MENANPQARGQRPEARGTIDRGAASGNRTPDLRITSALLCHLS